MFKTEQKGTIHYFEGHGSFFTYFLPFVCIICTVIFILDLLFERSPFLGPPLSFGSRVEKTIILTFFPFQLEKKKKKEPFTVCRHNMRLYILKYETPAHNTYTSSFHTGKNMERRDGSCRTYLQRADLVRRRDHDTCGALRYLLLLMEQNPHPYRSDTTSGFCELRRFIHDTIKSCGKDTEYT
jgi:hypothetical protein